MPNLGAQNHRTLTTVQLFNNCSSTTANVASNVTTRLKNNEMYNSGEKVEKSGMMQRSVLDCGDQCNGVCNLCLLSVS